MRSRISLRTARYAGGLAVVAALVLVGSGSGARASGATPATRTAARSGPAAHGWRIAVTEHYGAARNASGYSAIVAPARAAAWAFGGTNPGGASHPVALRWNGTRWQPWPLPSGLTGFIGDASAPSAGDIWAVSYTGGYVLHWNGTRWSVARRWPGGGVLTGVTAVSDTDVWVFGTTTTGVTGLGTWHFNGRAWARVRGPARSIYRASAVTRRDIWAVAAGRAGGIVEHFDGNSWRRIPTGSSLRHAEFDDVLARSPHDVWLTGRLRTGPDAGRLFVAHFDGRRWTRVLTRWHAGTGRLAADGRRGAWVTADEAGRSPHALIGHLTTAGDPAWAILRTGLASGISDIAAVPDTGRVWLSGGFLTAGGGDAVVWSRGGHQRSAGPAGSGAAQAQRALVLRAEEPDLAAAVLEQSPPVIFRARHATSAA